MNKASGGDGIPVELFQILKDDAVKVLHSICQQIWKAQQLTQDWKRTVLIPIKLLQILKENAVKVLHSICQKIWKTQQWPQDWEISVFIPVPKKDNAKKYSNYHTITLLPHANRVMLKILQARLQQYVNRELPDVRARFRKGRGTRDQIANIRWII